MSLQRRVINRTCSQIGVFDPSLDLLAPASSGRSDVSRIEEHANVTRFDKEKKQDKKWNLEKSLYI